MTGWQLEHPWSALAGLILLGLLYLGRRQWPENLRAGTGTHRTGGGMLLSRLLYAIALLAGLAAWANPRFGEQLVRQQREGIAIMNVLDTSQSMEAIDFGSGGQKLTRLAGAKQILEAFVKARAQDQSGLMVFGNQVFTLAPLTGDQNLILGYISQIQLGMAGQATALGDALGLAVKRLRDIPMESRVVIVLTDGKNNTGSLEPLESAELAAEEGIRVYTIGIGTNGRAPFLVDTLFGKKEIMQQVEMDEATLRQVARLTGGHYFNARNVEELRQIYQRIDALETSSFETQTSIQYTSHYIVPLALAILSLLMATSVAAWREKRFPA